MIKTKDGMIWKNAVRNKDDFLFPVKAMAIVFRAKYLHGLKKLIANQDVTVPFHLDIQEFISPLYSKDWVVYAKKPFGGPQQVIEYLGRYTHKVAITNNRIKKIDINSDTVTFDYKDYTAEGQVKEMELGANEFIRRFEQHILPKYFTKIRSYGYLSNRNRKANIEEISYYLNLPYHPAKVKVPWHVSLLENNNIWYNQCPHCQKLSLILVAVCFKDDS